MFAKNAPINSDVRLALLLAELSSLSWDFLCISETRAADADFLLDGGHRMVCSRGEFNYSGAAILIHAKRVDQVIIYKAVSDRIIFVDTLLHSKRYRIISVYMPHAR